MSNKSYLKKLIWITPAIITFLIALIPTLTYQWPLSWDIIYHIQYAQVYAKYGLVLTDPLLNAPIGQKIGYPPLFHLILASLNIITKINLYEIARIFQPILATSIVLSITYVGRKLYGNIAGISAGFLLLFSSLVVGRIILPLPENLALIFLPLSVYFYYYAMEKKTSTYALLAGLLFIIIIFIHELATLSLILIITSFSIVELFLYRNNHVFKEYITFILPSISLIVLGVLALLIWEPIIIHNILTTGFTATTGIITSISNTRPLNIITYLGYLGPILLFAIIGAIFAFKKRQEKDALIFTWIIVIFFLSNAYLFGLNVITYRVIIYLLIPLSMLGGFGLSQIYLKMKNYKRLSSKNLRIMFLVVIFSLAIFNGVLTVENPKIAIFAVENQYGAINIAPPSSSEIDLAQWFNENGDKTKSIMTNNLFTGTFLVTETGMPLHYGFEDFNKNIPEYAFKNGGIGYIVLDKRLTFKSNNGTLYFDKVSNNEFYPLIYFSGDISSNINSILPSFIKVVYENNDYIVCQVQ